MGTELPTDGVTAIDDGDQYNTIGAAKSSSYTLQLQGGKRIYHQEDFYGGINKAEPDNELFIPGHYYIIELKWIDTDVSVYGPDMSFGGDHYINGFCFDTPDEATPISKVGPNSDIMFGIFSTQDVYFIKIGWRFNAEPNGDSSIIVFLENDEMKIIEVIVDHEDSPEKEFVFDAVTRPMYLSDGGKLEFYYNDDFSDSVKRITGEATFWHEPPVVNG